MREIYQTTKILASYQIIHMGYIDTYSILLYFAWEDQRQNSTLSAIKCQVCCIKIHYGGLANTAQLQG